MADTPYPLPKSIRQTDWLVGTGATTYGPFGEQWGIFDNADVFVETRDAATGAPLANTATAEKTSLAERYSPFTITFPVAITSATEYRVTGRRQHERALAVTRGGAVDGVSLELELSKQSVVLQEHRRDIDGIDDDLTLEVAGLDSRADALDAAVSLLDAKQAQNSSNITAMLANVASNAAAIAALAAAFSGPLQSPELIANLPITPTGATHGVTLRDHVARKLSPLDFGPPGTVGTGGTDTAVVQLALTTAASAKVPLYLLGKTYLIDATISTPLAGAEIIGPGTIKVINNTLARGLHFTGDYAKVTGVNFDGNNLCRYGIQSDGANFTAMFNTVKSITALATTGAFGIYHNSPGGGISRIVANDIRDVTATNNAVLGDGVGSARGIAVGLVTDAQAVLVTENTVHNIRGEDGDGITVQYTGGSVVKANGIIARNTISDCDRRYIKTQVHSVVVDSNLCRQLGALPASPSAAISCQGGNDNWIVRNDVDAQGFVFGCDVGSSGTNVTGSKVYGNTFRGGIANVAGSATYGIVFYNGVDTEVRDNIVINFTRWILSSNNSGFAVEQNRWQLAGGTTRGRGFYTAGTNSFGRITRNSARGVGIGTQHFIGWDGSESIIADNDNQCGGINSACVEILAGIGTGNTFSNNRTAGTAAAVIAPAIYTATTTSTPPARTRIFLNYNTTSGANDSLVFSTGPVPSLILRAFGSFDPPAVAAGAEAFTDITVTGATIIMKAFAEFANASTGLRFTYAKITAADTVRVFFKNETGASIDLTSTTLTVWVLV